MSEAAPDANGGFEVCEDRISSRTKGGLYFSGVSGFEILL
jgi:hypothetical protein